MLKIENYVQCFSCLFFPLLLIMVHFKCISDPHPTQNKANLLISNKLIKIKNFHLLTFTKLCLNVIDEIDFETF